SVPEPEMPIDAEAQKRPGYIAPLPNGGGYLFERKDAGGKTSGVVVPGTVLVTRGMVELFGCGTGGKEHETVLRLECDVQSLDLALTSSGFKRGKLPGAGVREPEQGSRVVILVQWVDKDGKIVTHRSEDLVVSIRRNAAMPRVGWTYVAQWTEVPDPASPKGERTHKVLAVANSQSYVTTFRDRSALLDNPLEEAVDDTLYAANYMVLPRPGTPVRVIFRAPTAAEVKDIEALEKQIAREGKDFKPDDRPDKEDPK
ncbi:MAG TPA: YdjY domain-containing protein, partial [Planctomycetota bacterium]|nr:YdjY domain-containing protein [Planctomycetota bacterium]